jgi:hypothetical protein
MYCCLYAPGNVPILLDCARRFSPLIEEHPDMVVFDIRGLEALHGPPVSIACAIGREIGIPANITIASNPDTAVHAARGIDGVTVIAPGEEAAALGASFHQPAGRLAGCLRYRSICGASAPSASLQNCLPWEWPRVWARRGSHCTRWRWAGAIGA